MTNTPGDLANVVRTFWHGSDLSVYERLCLASFVKHGHTVQIFSYHDLTTIPGVERIDAASILPETEVFTYRDGPGKGSVAGFANLFRYKMLHDLGGTWVDADVLCLKSFSTLPSCCVGWQDAGEFINNAIMRFPAEHFLTKELFDRAKALGRSVGWAETGPVMLTEVLRRHRDQISILPREAFYPIHWSEAWKLVSTKEAERCDAAARASYCVHWWNEILRRMGIGKERLAPAGSYLHRHAREILGENDLDAWSAGEVDARIATFLGSSGLPARA